MRLFINGKARVCESNNRGESEIYGRHDAVQAKITIFNPQQTSVASHQLFHTMVEQGTLTGLQFIVEDPVEGPTLKSFIELEAEYNKPDLIKFLLDSHYTVKIENDKVVEISPKFRRSNFFHNYNGSNFLSCLLSRANDLPFKILQRLYEQLKKSGYIVDEIVAALAQARCHLDRVLLLKDTQVTCRMLELDYKYDVDYRSAMRAYENAIYTMDLYNLKRLLNYVPEKGYIRRIFIAELKNMLMVSKPDLERAKSLVKLLMSINFDEYLFYTSHFDFSTIFRIASAEVVLMLLECRFDEHAREIYKHDFLLYVFDNEKVDAVELLGNKLFDVNAVHNGNTALKMAVECGSERNVRWLLNKGALVNHPQRDAKPLALAIKSESMGMIELLLDRGANTDKIDVFKTSALHIAKNVELIKYLLLRGANAQALDQNNRTVFEDKGLSEWSMILAHLALQWMRLAALTVRPVFEKIESNSEFWDFLGKCLGQLRWMKTQKVYGSTTMFDVVCGKIGRVTRGMDVVGMREKMLADARKGEVDPYYVGLLGDKFEDVVLVRELKRKAGLVISEAIVVFDIGNLVIDKIINFLTLQDLMVFK